MRKIKGEGKITEQQCRWPRSHTSDFCFEINSNYRYWQLALKSIVKLSHPESLFPCFSLSLSLSFLSSFSSLSSLSVSARSAPPTSSISPARVTRERKKRNGTDNATAKRKRRVQQHSRDVTRLQKVRWVEWAGLRPWRGLIGPVFRDVYLCRLLIGYVTF